MGGINSSLLVSALWFVPLISIPLLKAKAFLGVSLGLRKAQTETVVS